MAGIFLRHALAVKYVSEVTAAVGAGDLYPAHAERTIDVADNGARDFVIKRRPAAAAVELVGRIVQRRITTAAHENSIAFKVVVFTGKGPFGAFMRNNLFFFRCEDVPVRIFIFSHFYENFTIR